MELAPAKSASRSVIARYHLHWQSEFFVKMFAHEITRCANRFAFFALTYPAAIVVDLK
ncbi:MAG: hypothetical protein GX617_11730 [Lentisphaerae bacterium]|nr:hypothetical protein [Lentisphaerota bacterium]